MADFLKIEMVVFVIQVNEGRVKKPDTTLPLRFRPNGAGPFHVGALYFMFFMYITANEHYEPILWDGETWGHRNGDGA